MLRVRRVVVPLLAAALLAGVVSAVPAAGAETGPQKIARLKSEAAGVQQTIDGMNTHIEMLAEQFNGTTEALARIKVAEVSTRRRLGAAEQALATAQAVLGARFAAIYQGGPVVALATILDVTDIHSALTTAKYQDSVVVTDRDLITRVDQARRQQVAIATELAAQEESQRLLQAKILGQRSAIEGQVAAEHAYLSKVSAAVKQAIVDEQKRQEELRRQALLRRLAAERAARARAAAAAAAAAARAEAEAQAEAQRRRQAALAAAEAQAQAPAPTPEPQPAPAPSPTPTPLPRGDGSTAVAWALTKVGLPYEWGAEGPSSFDCSGLTMMAWLAAGVSLPRTAAEQYYATARVGLPDLQPGDLLFFGTFSNIHHEGMYVGNGQMVEAPHTGAFVRVSSYYRTDLLGAGRP